MDKSQIERVIILDAQVKECQEVEDNIDSTCSTGLETATVELRAVVKKAVAKYRKLLQKELKGI